jgi:hypothetical protein
MPSPSGQANDRGRNTSASPQVPEKQEPQQASSDQDLHNRISRRAYELYCQRGYRDGEAVADWLDAEQEVRSQLSQTS